MIKTDSRVFQVTPDDESSEVVEIRERSLTLVQTTSLLLGEAALVSVFRIGLRLTLEVALQSNTSSWPSWLSPGHTVSWEWPEGSSPP